MSTQFPEIHIDAISNGDGTYDAYLSHDGSSGAHYDDIDAETIGRYTAEMIDDIEQNTNGNTYLKQDKPYLLIETDGYKIETTAFATKEEAAAEMKRRYKSYSPSEIPAEFKKSCYFCFTAAALYTGNDVYLWQICNTHKL